MAADHADVHAQRCEPSPRGAGRGWRERSERRVRGRLLATRISKATDADWFCPSPASPLSRLGTLSPLRFASRGEGYAASRATAASGTERRSSRSVRQKAEPPLRRKEGS